MATKKDLPHYQPVTRAKKPSLEAALAELDEGGDRALALDHLLGVWQDRHEPGLADVIDLLSDELTLAQPPIRAVGAMSAKKMWNKLASEGQCQTVGRLLETLPDNLERYYRLQTFIDAAEASGPDPRCATYAKQWFETPPVHGTHRSQFFGKVVELLVKTNDVRILDMLRERVGMRSPTIRAIGQRTWSPLLALVEHLEKDVRIKKLSATETETLAAIRAKIAAPPRKKESAEPTADPKIIFAKVYADPTDDEPRAVLGDLLQQQGDPRGEFIALQLGRPSGAKRSARERELEDQWGREWLGPLEPCILKGGVVFERGFLSECRYSGGSAGDAARDCDEWATVTSLDCSTASGFVGGSVELLTSPKLRSLKHVVGLGSQDNKLFNEKKRSFPGLETIGMRLYRIGDATPLTEAAAANAFPNVKRLVFESTWNPSILDAQPEAVTALLKPWPKLESFEITLEPQVLASVATSKELQSLNELRLHLRRVARFDLRPKDKTLTIVLDHLHDMTVSLVRDVLRSILRARTITSARFTVPGRPKREEKDMVSRGRYERVSIKPILDEALGGAIELTVL